MARLLLHNIPHIKAYWIMLGVKTAQTALWFGADDLDGTVQEERIYHMAGAETPQTLSPDEIVRIIVNAGRAPVERDTLYNVVAEGDALLSRKPFRRAVHRIPGGAAVSARKLRLAAVSFLNARPITYGLERGRHGTATTGSTCASTSPRRCAEALARGEVDLALLPLASYAHLPRRRCASCRAWRSPAGAPCARCCWWARCPGRRWRASRSTRPRAARRCCCGC